MMQGNDLDLVQLAKVGDIFQMGENLMSKLKLTLTFQNYCPHHDLRRSISPQLRCCALKLYFSSQTTVCNAVAITICLADLSTAITTFALQELMMRADFCSKNAEISISYVSSSLTTLLHIIYFKKYCAKIAQEILCKKAQEILCKNISRDDIR